jgi:hypothetical protein
MHLNPPAWHFFLPANINAMRPFLGVNADADYIPLLDRVCTPSKKSRQRKCRMDALAQRRDNFLRRKVNAKSSADAFDILSQFALHSPDEIECGKLSSRYSPARVLILQGDYAKVRHSFLKF